MNNNDTQSAKKLASVWQRILAYIIDAFIYWLVPVFLINYLSSSSEVSMLLSRLSFVLVFMIFVYPVLFALFISFFVSYFGGTLGKILTGSKIVSGKGENISFWRAFFRNHIGYMISGVFLWFGFIWIFIDKEKQAWHDQIADTYVLATNKAISILGVIVLIAVIFLELLTFAGSVANFAKNGNTYNELMTVVNESFSKETSSPISK